MRLGRFRMGERGAIDSLTRVELGRNSKGPMLTARVRWAEGSP